MNTLSFYEFGVEHRLEMLQGLLSTKLTPVNNLFPGQVDAHASTLSNEQAAFILTRGGIATIYATCDRFKVHSPFFLVSALNLSPILEKSFRACLVSIRTA